MENDSQLIEAYINGELSGTQLQYFEQRLEEDTDFNNSYQAQLAAHKLIREAGRLELKKTLESFEDTTGGGRVVPLWVKRIIPIAAMLVIFFGVYYFMQENTAAGTSNLYNSYFESYPAPANLRDINNSDSDWEQALGYYEEGKFNTALESFSKVKKDVPEYLIAFYSGLAEMQAEPPNPLKAIENFNIVLDSDNDYSIQALWYKSLCLLKLKRENQARATLRELISAESYKQVQAQEIMDVLAD